MVIEDNRGSTSHKNFDFHRASQHIPEHHLAHPLDRLAAFVVDFAVLFLICSLVVAPLQRKMKMAQLVNQSEQLLMVILGVIAMVSVISLIYQFVFMSWKGGTIGKLLFGLRVIDVWTGKPARTADLMLRSLVWMADTLALCLPHFGLYSDPMRRPFHDRISNTIVVSVTQRHGHKPRKSEMTFVRSLFVLFYFLAFIIFSEHVLRTYSIIAADDQADVLNIASLEYCEDVSRVQPEWPMENGQPAMRVSIALALYAAGAIEESCLDQEAYLQFETGDHREIAYLARAFATSDESQLSDRYLDRVCEDSESSEACHLSELINLWTERSWETATSGFLESLKNSSVYMKIWAVKHFEKVKDFQRELAILDELWPLPGINQFLSPHRTVALWGLNKKQEARVSMASAVEALPRERQMGLASFMCYNELEDGCESALPQSCRHFLNLSEDSATAYSQELYSVTHLRLAECRQGQSFESLRTMVDEPNVLELIKAAEFEQKGDADSAIEIYKDLFSSVESQSVVHNETLRRLLLSEFQNLSENDRKQILLGWHEASPADYWNWFLAGRRIVNALVESGRYVEALQEGKYLLSHDPKNEDVTKSLAVASYRSKNFALAKKYIMSLEQIPVRVPASEEPYLKIKKELLGKGR